ncbi:MAG: c-type cytochrome [Bacteroidia bacterium]|nr:c-type cytochrome [Bacteroidia bacterium]MDW8348390.1 cytochrome c peroxidase [Bacteroidia bacterium]
MKKSGWQIVAVIGSFIFIFVACQRKETQPLQTEYKLNIPPGFPMPKIPADNPLTAEKVALGRKLFYDPQLSNARTISCASCHILEHGFADTARFSRGDKGQIGQRNAMSLTNVAYQTELFWDGANPSLEKQILAVMLNHDEFDIDITEVENRIRGDESYKPLFQAAFNGVINITTITQAIASFERTLISGNSKYDKYLRGQAILTPSELNGMRLFFDEKGECFHCHNGFNFTNFKYHNTGLDSVTTDEGRYRTTGIEEDKGKFKTPTLRNIALTAPYMHDGRFKTLEEVVEHYNRGGKNHPYKDGDIFPLNLTAQEKQDIVNFLKTLTDEEFINNPAFKKP